MLEGYELGIEADKIRHDENPHQEDVFVPYITPFPD